MVQMTYDEYDELENFVENMEERLGYDSDQWYPTMNDLKKNLDFDNITADNVKFLIYCLHPKFKLNAEQEKVRKEIQNLLYKPEVLSLVDEEDKQRLKAE